MGILFTNPGEEFPQFRRRFEFVCRIQFLGQLLIAKERVDLLMAGGANIDQRTHIAFFAAGVLTGDEVMDREVGAIAIAELALHKN